MTIVIIEIVVMAMALCGNYYGNGISIGNDICYDRDNGDGNGHM